MKIIFTWIVFSALYSLQLHCQVTCKELENSFYTITNLTPTGNYKDDVKKWLESDAFVNYLSKRDSLFKIIIPIIDLDSEIILNKNNTNSISFIRSRISNLDDKLFNNGFANFIVSQITDPITLKKWRHCKNYLNGLDVFVYDTIADAFRLHLSSRTFSESEGIKIEKPVLINAIVDTPRIQIGTNIYSGGAPGYFEISGRRQNLLKPTFIIINPIDDYEGIFIYLHATDSINYSITNYLNGDFFIQQSHRKLTNCGLKNLIQDEEEANRIDTNFVHPPPKMDEWTPEQIDCYLMSNYLYDKGIVLKIIKNIVEDPSPFVRNKLPAYQRALINVETKFLKKTIIINPLWHRTFPYKVYSY